MTARPPAETDVVVELARAAAGQIDTAFLTRLVDVLRRYMNVSLAFVGIGQGTPPTQVSAVYAVRGDVPAESFTYELSGAPCELVYASDETVVLPCDLARQFPREAGYESYLGLPLHDAEGSVIGHLAVFSDREIADAKRATALLQVLAQRVEDELRRRSLEEQREQLLADLRRQSRRLRARHSTIRAQNAYKTRLLGIIAHDLRRPLSALLSQAELAQTHARRNSPDIARLDRACGKVITNAEAMSALIDATLERVREEDGNLSLEIDRCDAAAILRLAVDAALPEAGRKSITITLGSVPDVALQGDEVLLLRALDNLVSNAVKYTPKGGTVRVGACAGGGWLEMVVEDDGQGLTTEDLTRVAGRFQTLSAKPTGGETATGLGLSNVREIAEAHGGRLEAESAGRGRGATFRLVVPLG